MKTIKHFFGWLFGYCPYGSNCPPKRPFTKEGGGFPASGIVVIKTKEITATGNAGGGC